MNKMFTSEALRVLDNIDRAIALRKKPPTSSPAAMAPMVGKAIRDALDGPVPLKMSKDIWMFYCDWARRRMTRAKLVSLTADTIVHYMY